MESQQHLHTHGLADNVAQHVGHGLPTDKSRNPTLSLGLKIAQKPYICIYVYAYIYIQIYIYIYIMVFGP